jgi:hypothetical protein
MPHLAVGIVLFSSAYFFRVAPEARIREITRRVTENQD